MFITTVGRQNLKKSGWLVTEARGTTATRSLVMRTKNGRAVQTLAGITRAHPSRATRRPGRGGGLRLRLPGQHCRTVGPTQLGLAKTSWRTLTVWSQHRSSGCRQLTLLLRRVGSQPHQSHPRSSPRRPSTQKTRSRSSASPGGGKRGMSQRDTRRIRVPKLK